MHKINKVNRKDGFTLIEIMVVVVIIGILAAIAIPAFQRAGATSRASAFSGSIESISTGALNYAMEVGDWAPAGTGTLPAALQGYIAEGPFETEAPTGGNWIIDNGTNFTSAVGVTGAISDDETFTRIDETIDDGNLGTGVFQKVADGTFYYILAE